MFPPTPFKITLDDLFVEVRGFYIDMLHFIPNVSTFIDDVFPITGIKGRYLDLEFHKSATVQITIVVCGTLPTDQTLSFKGYFTINRHSAINIPKSSVILTQYCFEIIQDFIKDKPIVDKNGKLYAMPGFFYSDEHFKNVQFEYV